MKLLDLFNEADIVKYPLGLFSILALAIVLERAFTLLRLKSLEDQAFLKLQAGLESGNTGIVGDPQIAAAPVSQVMGILTTLRGASRESLLNASEVAIAQQRLRLRRYLSTLATIGSTAPFIGLFGTVLGVLGAFKDMSKSGQGAMEGSAVAGSIGTALSATAIGLLVAIPAVMAYNYLTGLVQANVLNISGHVSRLLPLLETPHDLRAAVSNGRAHQEV